MFERIKLPYGYGDLEPHIDAQTVETHYEKHHKTYTDNFNTALKECSDCSGKSARDILLNLNSLPEAKRKAIRNNGGGFFNHNLYFESLIPGGKQPQGKLKEQIEKDFGSLESLVSELHQAATATLFGSGWAWLVGKNGKLSVTITPNQDTPLMEGDQALLLPVDMWEHAYYLKYKSEKKKYADEFFKIVNWEKVGERFEKGE